MPKKKDLWLGFTWAMPWDWRKKRKATDERNGPSKNSEKLRRVNDPERLSHSQKKKKKEEKRKMGGGPEKGGCSAMFDARFREGDFGKELASGRKGDGRKRERGANWNDRALGKNRKGLPERIEDCEKEPRSTLCVVPRKASIKKEKKWGATLPEHEKDWKGPFGEFLASVFVKGGKGPKRFRGRELFGTISEVEVRLSCEEWPFQEKGESAGEEKGGCWWGGRGGGRSVRWQLFPRVEACQLALKVRQGV